jgi:hypothetical protein
MCSGRDNQSNEAPAQLSVAIMRTFPGAGLTSLFSTNSQTQTTNQNHE